MATRAWDSYKAFDHRGIKSRTANHPEVPVITLLLFLLSFSHGGIAQTLSGPYQVGTWQGFRSAAVSYTFDDNCPNQLSIAVPMFDEFGFKLTLFTVTSSSWGWKADWSGLQKAASEGHEIASHTITHPNFSTLADSLQKQELEFSQDTINAHVTGQKCITIAYPYCVTGNSALVASYYIAARGCSGQIVAKTPSDFMNISSIVLGDQGLNAVAAIESPANSAVAAKGWCVYLIHGINGTEPGAYSPISQDTLLATLQYLNANPDEFWVAPFGTVARYIIERNSTSVTEISNYGDSIRVQLTDNLDSDYYDIPITIRRSLPEGWDSVVVLQNGDTLSSQMVKVDTVKYVMFDGVPNAGNITIVNETGTAVGLRGGFASPEAFGLLQNYPNPFNPSTKITYQLSKSGYVTLKVYDVLGRAVAVLVNQRQNAGNYNVTFDANNLSSGAYFYRISTEEFSDVKKLVLVR
ncbi:MAG TPA: polysaccharide deacetylase family protein [Candidatus Acidoferrales bacterium]|nr:polysaccharide deacetylase family protein [Candidatus Acidoferrales bacterium]